MAGEQQTDDLTDVRLAIKALAYYVHARGRVVFHDSGASHPARDRAFTVSFTVQDAALYGVIWRRLMHEEMTRKRSR